MSTFNSIWSSNSIPTRYQRHQAKRWKEQFQTF